MQLPASGLEVVDGVVVRKGSPPGSPSMSLAEIARIVAPTSRARGQHEPGLSAEGWFFTDHMVYPYGIHVAVVRVDRDTGGAEIERYLVAYDVGKALNPMLIEGQIAGGLAQGIGGALFEEFLYDPRGEPLSVNFADYLIVSSREMPPVDVLVTEDAPSPRNPLGLKGAGEAGTNAAGAAIAAAIDDAIGMPGAVTTLPVTPQRLKAILARTSETARTSSP
jgi:carbon-monoxide dehydrogenase large subunit/6-hydroxypseudooxynicotine dehydrogenase subunit gamma